MFHRRRLFIALILTWIVEVFHCFGQSSAMTGEISGTVTDPVGGSIPDAVVTVTNIATRLRQTTKTGSSGLYRFSLLPLGAYDLETKATRFTAATQSGIEVAADATITVNLSMQLQGFKTRVDVTLTIPPTDPARTDQGTILDENTTSNLPLVSRNPYNFIRFQPYVGGIENTEFGCHARLRRTASTIGSIMKSTATTIPKVIVQDFG